MTMLQRLVGAALLPPAQAASSAAVAALPLAAARCLRTHVRHVRSAGARGATSTPAGPVESGRSSSPVRPVSRGASAASEMAVSPVRMNQVMQNLAQPQPRRPAIVPPLAHKIVPPVAVPPVKPRDDAGDAAYSTADASFAIQPGASVWTSDRELRLQLGGTLPRVDVAYETWGNLNRDKSNVILLHTGMSAHTHAASSEVDNRQGWWERFIGPDRPLDTNKYFVICTNVLGSCYGTTGPSSVSPHTGRPYGSSFPAITVDDMIHAQFRLLDSMGIDRLHASVGSSLGGMQSLTAAALYPDRVGRLISISAAARSHPSSIAIRFAQRQAITSDPDWMGGHFYGSGHFPLLGMKNARIIGTISYRSGPEWETRFFNKRQDETVPMDQAHGHNFGPDFLVESYLSHQAETFSTRFDPNSLLYISKAMDMFDMGRGFASLQEGLARIKAPTLVLGVQSDILFPVKQQKEIADMLRASGNKRVTYYELDAIYGHDTFLLDVRNVGSAVKGHLDRVME